ncbi:hypothetical protein MNY64_18210 (plasmid) [Moellerella wisconsensis]|uniref:hypothetical protein n=1 Tax=Moellerella wisconsensis TaxID=158849 RepID=UPI001F4EC771|nr:hypothetical protein [Moellerella wisconsensis]UNH29332.1 hypothetical protein MNY64_18210 [Moellerella wisconsensis]
MSIYEIVGYIALIILFLSSKYIRYLTLLSVFTYFAYQFVFYMVSLITNDYSLKLNLDHFVLLPLTILTVVAAIYSFYKSKKKERMLVEQKLKERKEEQAVKDQQQKEHSDKRKLINNILYSIEDSNSDTKLVMNAMQTLQFIKKEIEKDPLNAVSYKYAIEHISYAYQLSSYRQEIFSQLEVLDSDELKNATNIFNGYRDKITSYKSFCDGFLLREAAHKAALFGNKSALNINDI